MEKKNMAARPEMRVERLRNGRVNLLGVYAAGNYLGMPHQELRRIVLNILNPPPRVRAYMEKVRRVKEAYPELFKGVA